MTEKEDLGQSLPLLCHLVKYKGCRLIDLPEEYLLVLPRKDSFGRALRQLMQLTLAIKTEGFKWPDKTA